MINAPFQTLCFIAESKVDRTCLQMGSLLFNGGESERNIKPQREREGLYLQITVSCYFSGKYISGERDRAQFTVGK